MFLNKKYRKKIPRQLIRIIALSIVVILGTCSSFFLSGKVVVVHDGDTISVLAGTNIQKIRLYGIDSPETRQQGGKDAANFTSSVALFHEVTVTPLETDQYGRTVAIVTLPDGTTLNELLVQNGHAWVYHQHCKIVQCASWKIKEQKAKYTKEGFWGDANPTPPWTWRKQKK